jgi:hypothetical protein
MWVEVNAWQLSLLLASAPAGITSASTPHSETRLFLHPQRFVPPHISLPAAFILPSIRFRYDNVNQGQGGGCSYYLVVWPILYKPGKTDDELDTEYCQGVRQ